MVEDSSVSAICGCFLKWCFEPLTLVDEGISWEWGWGWMVRLSSQVAQAHYGRSVYIDLFYFAYIMTSTKYKSLYEKCGKYALIAINAK